MDMNEAVAKALGAERQVADMTVRKLAEAAGIPERSLMRILQAERDIKVNQVAALADALGLFPHEVIEHAEVIMQRSQRERPSLAEITPSNVTVVSFGQDEDTPASEQQKPAAKETHLVKDEGHDEHFDE